MPRQLSFLAADVAPPSIDDVDGLLAGPAHTARRADKARLSVLVGDEWRAEALVAAFAELGIEADTAAAPRRHQDEAGEVDSLVVRTAFSAALAGLAARWSAGAVKRPPPDWRLTGGRLRWWCLAAGAPDAGGFALRLAAGDEPSWPAIGAALSAAALPAVLVGVRGGGPAYRVVGRRRVHRLAELVGDPPPGVPPEYWPAIQAPAVGRSRP